MILVIFSGKAATWCIMLDDQKCWTETLIGWWNDSDTVRYWYAQEIWQVYGNDMMRRMMMTMKTMITITMTWWQNMIRCDVWSAVTWYDMMWYNRGIRIRCYDYHVIMIWFRCNGNMTSRWPDIMMIWHHDWLISRWYDIMMISWWRHGEEDTEGNG